MNYVEITLKYVLPLYDMLQPLNHQKGTHTRQYRSRKVRASRWQKRWLS